MLAALVAVLLLLVGVVPARGGSCWTGVSRGGRCTDLVQERVTQEDCCGSSGPGGASGASGAAWSPEDMDAGALFYWRVLGGGVKCTPCRDSCVGVSCSAGRRCAVRWGRPQCVCAPDCSRLASRRASRPGGPGGPGGQVGVLGASSRGSRGPVCGSDGRSYRSACRLAKRACRKKSSSLSIAYHGVCQKSCERVSCGAGRSCVLDQNLTPHCVKCARRCPARVAPSRAVCGADGFTYESACHLRDAACRKGKAIPVAYRGRCKKAASCGAALCRPRQSCLSDLSSGAARCVHCAYRCSRSPRRGHVGPSPSAPDSSSAGSVLAAALIRAGGGIGDRMDKMDNEPVSDFGGPVCGSNNRTYLSWCHMLKDACATGYVIETQHPGSCGQPGSLSSPLINTVLDDNSFA